MDTISKLFDSLDNLNIQSRMGSSAKLLKTLNDFCKIATGIESRFEICSICNGNGAIEHQDPQDGEPCKACNEWGWVEAMPDKNELEAAIKMLLDLSLRTETADNDQQRQYNKDHSQYIRNLVTHRTGIKP